MKRIKLRKKRKFDKINTVIVVIILLFLSIIIVLSYLNSKLSPFFLDFAELETTKIANLIINDAVTKHISSDVDIDKLFSAVQNKDGEIQTIDFNPIVVSKILSSTTNSVYNSLKAVEQGNIDTLATADAILLGRDKNKLKKGIIFEIPLGAVFGNAFLTNLGPRIPVKLTLIGSIISNINTNIRQYGINNALLEVCVKIDITEKINLPLTSKSILVSSEIPIAIKIIQGKIPSYYNSTGLTQSSPIFTLPLQ